MSKQFRLKWSHAGTMADFQGDEWVPVLLDYEIADFLEMVGVTKGHPDFERANNILLIRVDEIKTGGVDTILSVQSNEPWALHAPVYHLQQGGTFMRAICDACQKAAMHTVEIGQMTVCDECTGRAWSKMRFVKWMAEVDEACTKMAGVSVHDLSDQPFADSFEDGVEPFEMAEVALEDNGWPG